MPGTLSTQTSRQRLALLLGLLALAPAVPAASFTATLDRGSIYADEQAILSLTVTDGATAAPLAPPAVPGLTFSHAGRSQRLNIINGQRSSAVSDNFRITADKPGDYTIPPIRAVIDGKELTSRPLALKVLPSPDRAKQIGAFLQLNPAKTNVYLGEVLPVEIRLYSRAPVVDENARPDLAQEGLTVGKMLAKQPVRAEHQGQLYYLFAYPTYVIPARSGTLKLGPASLSVVVPRPGSPLSFFGEPLESMAVTLRSPVIDLTVLSLPTNHVPVDFSGAVGDYRIAVQVSTNRVTAGDPITITVNVGGQGPIESLRLSPFDEWSGFKAYPPVTRVQLADEFGLQGVKTFEQVVIPESPAIKEIPPITFSFFNPVAGTYRTLSHPGTPLTVLPGATLPAQRLLTAQAPTEPDRPPLAATDIVHIKPRLGVYGLVQSPLILRPWFLALQALPILGWLAASAWRRREDAHASNPLWRRRQQVARLTRMALADLRSQAADGRSEAFFATAFRLLQEHLGLRLNRPAASITEAVLEEELEPAGVDADTLRGLRQLFQACNVARYAPERSRQELSSFLPQIEATLRQLQTWPPHDQS